MFLCETLTEQQQAPPQVAPAGQPPQQVVVQQPVQAAPQANQYQQDADYDSELDGEDEEMVAEQIPPFQEILPLKKYYLIQKLKKLKSRLDEFDLINEDLNIIMKFMNNISYNSLMSLTINILPVIEEQLARLQTDEV